jgi:beta-mannosidase
MEIMQKTNWKIACLESIKELSRAEWRDVQIPVMVQNSPFGLPIEVLYQGSRIGELDWMRERHWAFRTAFTVPDVGIDEEAVYRFNGIEYDYDIYINDERVLSREGMFSPVEVPVPQGGNELTVLIKPFADQDVREHMKARYTCGIGWDFAPKLLTAGIWDNAGLVVRKKLRVVSVNIETTLGSDQRADVVVHAELSQSIKQGTVAVEIAGITRRFPIVDAANLALPVNVPSPKLWWPNGMGEANLTELKLWINDSLTYTAKVGLRSVSRVACEGQSPEDMPLQLVINNKKVFIKGVNWVPPDSCPAEITTERYERFLRQFKDAGVNLVRIWGGGLIEKEGFYETADRLGLMVMQDFPLACQPLARTARFYAIIGQEIPAIIRRLTRHPSIVLWTGGNELYHYWDSVDSGTPAMNEVRQPVMDRYGFDETTRAWQAHADRYDEPSIAMMGEITARLDGTRPFELTSGMEGEGECHGIWTWDPSIGDERFRDYATLYDFWLDANQHFYSEACVSSIANLETIHYVLNTDTPGMPDPEDTVWRAHHAFGAAWKSERTWLDSVSIEKLFGKINNMESLILASQWMQGEGGRFLIEEIRRKAGHTCGVIWWGVNEPWPGLAGNALIDYFGRPKLGMSFLANAYKPTILSLRYPHCVLRRLKPELWLSHDGPKDFEGTYEVRVRNLTAGAEDVYTGSISAASGQSRYIKTLVPLRMRPGAKAHIECKLFDATGLIHKNDYLFASNEDEAPFAGELLKTISTLYGRQA